MIDIGILLILVMCSIIGYSKGLIRTVIALLSSVVALIGSFIMFPLLNSILKLTPLYEVIYNGVLSKVEKIDFGKGIQTQGNVIMDQINWLPDIFKEHIKSNNNAAMYELLDANNIYQYVTSSITQMIIGLIAILILWVILKIVLMGVLKLFRDVVESLPVISTLNKWGGLGVGLLKGMIILSIVVLILPFLVTLPGGEGIQALISESKLIKWLYDYNIILLLYNNYFIS